MNNSVYPYNPLSPPSCHSTMPTVTTSTACCHSSPTLTLLYTAAITAQSQMPLNPHAEGC